MIRHPGRDFAACLLVLGLPLLLIAGLGAVSGSLEFGKAAMEILIKVVAVVGLYIFIGNSGFMSFGHVGFIAIGAYASAWQTCCEMLKPMVMSGLPDVLLYNTVPSVPAALVSGLFAMLLGLPVGAIILRLNGLAASIASFAMLFVVNVVYSNADSYTQGVGSIVGLPDFLSPISAFAWALAAVAVAFLFQTSRFGLLLRASREDEVAARASGVRVLRYRLMAFSLSAFVLGVAGALYGSYLGTISVDTFFLDMTFMLIAMLVVGGKSSLSGAVAGVVTLSLLSNLLRKLTGGLAVGGLEISIPEGAQVIVVALTMLTILRIRPGGLLEGREFWEMLGRPSLRR